MLSDDDLRKILDHFDLPWEGYRKVRRGVRKRLGRHMEALACRDVSSYLELAAQRPEVRVRCRQCLVVTISRFFRDRRLWEQLGRRWLPALMRRFPQGLEAWSAGSAGGEEPYTLAMLWTALAEERQTPLRLLATDVNPECLARARFGIYDAGSMREVPEDFRQRFFIPMPGHRFAVLPRLRECIRWEAHDLLHDPLPASGPFHIVLLRNNLLTYYRGESQLAALDRVLGRLVPGGLLILGSHERLPAVSRPLARDEACPWVYQLSEDAGCAGSSG